MGYGVGSAGSGSINIRGQGGRPNTGLLVLINGHPDFMGLFGHPLPDVYGTDDISQVDVLSGPASTVFGSQAMAGVVNIKSTPDFSILKISTSADLFLLQCQSIKAWAGTVFTDQRQQAARAILLGHLKFAHLQAGLCYLPIGTQRWKVARMI
jgi:hypothetical protein